MEYKPPFEQTNEIVLLVADISEKVGQLGSSDSMDSSPQLRRENRIQTIHSSLAIEHNSLSLEQVTAVIEGKHVIAPQRDILEVQNALAAYEAIDELNPYSIDDLLAAHKLLMAGLTNEAGMLRSGNVGVFDGDKLIHAGTPSQYVPEVLASLFQWLKDTSVHPLVASCAFHYELEFIHPFQDGNGRMGRLWQTLILKQWNPVFAWLPVETLVKEHQTEYYDALASSDSTGDSTTFITFMLGMINDVLSEQLKRQSDVGINVEKNVGINTGVTTQEEKLLKLVVASPSITIAEMSKKLGISGRQVERLLSSLKSKGCLERIGAKRNGYWQVTKE